MSTLKWKINNKEYAYIANESGVTPFIYNADNQKRLYPRGNNVNSPIGMQMKIEVSQSYDD